MHIHNATFFHLAHVVFALTLDTHFRRPKCIRRRKIKLKILIDVVHPSAKFIRSLYCLIDSRNWYTITVLCQHRILISFPVRFVLFFAWVDIVYLRAPYKRREKNPNKRMNEWKIIRITFSLPFRLCSFTYLKIGFSLHFGFDSHQQPM